MVLILVPGVSFAYAEWNYFSTTNFVNAIEISSFLMILPPVIAVALQLLALNGLTRIGGKQFTISFRQIAFQSVSCVLTMLADVTTGLAYYNFVNGGKTFAFLMVALAFNAIAFITLIMTLNNLAVL